jgi:hypothetical protein
MTRLRAVVLRFSSLGSDRSPANLQVSQFIGSLLHDGLMLAIAR